MNRKKTALISSIMILMFVSGFVAATFLNHEQHLIQSREEFANRNTVTLDLMKSVPDDSLVANGWKYIGVENGKYHYQYVTHNVIMNAGQNWMVSMVTGNAPGGRAVYIALGTSAGAASRTDVSIAGGELGTAGLTRVQAAYTAIGAAVGGTVTWTFVHTFTAGAAASTVQVAGLFTTTGANSPQIWAESTFAACNLATNDTLQITWTFVSQGA